MWLFSVCPSWAPTSRISLWKLIEFWEKGKDIVNGTELKTFSFEEIFPNIQWGQQNRIGCHTFSIKNWATGLVSISLQGTIHLLFLPPVLTFSFFPFSHYGSLNTNMEKSNMLTAPCSQHHGVQRISKVPPVFAVNKRVGLGSNGTDSFQYLCSSNKTDFYFISFTNTYGLSTKRFFFCWTLLS